MRLSRMLMGLLLRVWRVLLLLLGWRSWRDTRSEIRLPMSSLGILVLKITVRLTSHQRHLRRTLVYNMASSVPVPFAFAVNSTQNTLHHSNSRPCLALIGG